MYYNQDELEKIKIIDRAFNALSLEDVKGIFGSDIVVDKLKGIQDRDGPLAQAAKELKDVYNDMSMLRSEVGMLRSDFQILVQAVIKGPADGMTSSNLNSIKSRYGIY